MRQNQISRPRRIREAVEARLTKERLSGLLRPEPRAGGNPPNLHQDERRDDK